MASLPSRRRGWKGPALLVAIGVWFFVLRGFVSTSSLIVLSVIGPLALFAGVYLAIGAGRRVFQSLWSAGGLVLALGLVAGSAGTLAPGAPADLLVWSSSGWQILERRAGRVDDAVSARDIGLARRLMTRGLGDPAPAKSFGLPLLHGAESAEMLGVLLAGGLDPDAKDGDGRTLLMKTYDPALARLLLEAGADTRVTDRQGFSPADYHLRGHTPVRPVIESHLGAPLVEQSGEMRVAGRTEWLLDAASSALDPSALTIDPQPARRGQLATIRARLANPSESDHVVDVRMTLNQVALFVAASHDGAIEDRARPQAVQAIRWPLLSLPARSAGQLELQVLMRSEDAGDLGIELRSREVPNREEEILRISGPLAPLATPQAEAGGSAQWWFALIWLAMAATLLLLVHRLQRRVRATPARVRAGALDGTRAGARPVAILVALACGGTALMFLWAAVEPYLRFAEASCTILDRRVYARTPATGASPRGSSRLANIALPLTAVRIDAEGAPVIAAGFAAGAVRPVQALRDYPLGAKVSCWVDPESTTRFTLVRHPDLSSVAAITTLSLLAVLFAALARRPGPQIKRARS